MKTSPPTIKALFEARLDWMAYHNYSKTTRKNERITLAKFEQWCSEREIHHPQDLIPGVIEQYQRWISYQKDKVGNAWSGSYHIQLIGALQRCLKWALEQGYLLIDPSNLIERPCLPQQLPVDVLSVEEIEKVMEQPHLDNPLELRDRAILELLYATALRLNEVVSLKGEDIDYERRLVWIKKAKANKDRVIPVSQRALDWIAQYETEVRTSLAKEGEDILFLSKNGKSLLQLPQIKQYIFKATGKKGSCHLLRHSVATIMVENGCDVRTLQEFLGHENVNTTQRYTHVRPTDLKIMIQKYHPSENPVYAQYSL